MAAQKKVKKPGKRDKKIQTVPPGMRNLTAQKPADLPDQSFELTRQTQEELIHELRVHQTELETRAEELRRIQHELEISRSKFLDLYDFAPNGYVTLDDKAMVTEANLTLATLLGIERKNLAGARFRGFIAPGDRESWDRFFIHLSQRGERYSQTITLVRKDDTRFPGYLEGTRRDTTDGSIRIDLAISDISSLKETEAALKEREQFLYETENIAKVGGWKANPHTNYLHWTDGIYDILKIPRGYQPDFTEGLKWFSNDDIPLVRNSIKTCLDTGKPFSLDLLVTAQNGEKVWTKIQGIRPVKEAGQSFVIGTFQDITERRRTEDLIRKESGRLGILADSARLLMSSENPEPVIHSIGEMLMQYLHCEMFFNYLMDESGQRMQLNAFQGVPQEIARKFEFLNPGETVCNRGDRGDGQGIAFDIIRTDDEKKSQICPSVTPGWVYSPIIYHDRLFGALSFGNHAGSSFTENELDMILTTSDLVAMAMAWKFTEQKARKTASLLNAALNATTDGILAVDTRGTITSYNKTFCAFWGIPDNVLHGAEEKKALAYMTSTVEDPGHFINLLQEYDSHPGLESHDTIRLRDGRLLERYSRPQKIQDIIVGRVWSYRDITGRKKAEEALQETLEKFRIIATNTPDHILLMDTDLRYTQVINPPLGLAEQDMIGYTDLDIMSPENARMVMNHKRQVMESGIAQHLELSLPDASGSLNFLSGTLVPKRNSSGEVDGLIGYFRNVTETKQANEKIVAALAEKEGLIREIHHRVKNNLQIIYGLLYMTTSRTDDPAAKEILTDLMLKVKTMAQIHTRLYQSKQYNKIDMGTHIQDQVADLSSIYGRSGPEITCTIDAEGLYLPVDVAIPCALAINEALSNAFKHAFRGRRHGTIRVSAQEEDSTIHIRIDDDGTGIPKDVDIDHTSSLGLKLIRSLVQQQLQGTLAIESSDRGLSIIIDFPLKTTGE